MRALSLALTDGLNIHLNLNQTSLVNTSSIVVSIIKLPIDTFFNQTLSDQQVTFPSQVNLSTNRSQSIQVRLFSLASKKRDSSPLQWKMERLASFGSNNVSIQIQTNLSRLITLSILDSNGLAMEVKASRIDPFIFFIPHEHPFLCHRCPCTM